MDAGALLHLIVVVLCLIAVAFGAIPVLVGVYQYLLLPVHAVRNHLSEAAPCLPRVAVLVPAWNEAAVLPASLDRMMHLDYPADRLRVFVVDDASTDATPEVLAEAGREWPGRIMHLRREQGGQGKAHTLNHGLAEVLADRWAEAVLITDADVIFEPSALRRMTRHLADPEIGAVTAYIREGTDRPRAVARFVGFEYITAQACARRAQNVIGAVACLAGGAQLHTRENLLAIGGRIDTTTLAEDTFSTLLTQLGGRRVIFEPYAGVLAEEPDSIAALWKQRLRWARGNVQITGAFRKMWFRPSKEHRLGSLSFGLIWFSVFLLPVANIAASLGLVTLYFIDEVAALQAFYVLWWVSAMSYVFVTLTSLLIDTGTARRSWVEGVFFPGFGAIVVMTEAWFPGFTSDTVPTALGLPPIDTHNAFWLLALYTWNLTAMVLAWLLREAEHLRPLRPVARFLLYVVGLGPLLCAVTFDAYIKQARGATMKWEKTEKVGRVKG